MKHIHILDTLLANQIAAGEVVERPSSVVKELLENSFDAGSTDVLIEIEQGGHQLIRIRDNGNGIRKNELKLALARHATSKITHSHDLACINSLGFRGEALASIASIARVELVSHFVDEAEAFKIQAENGSESDLIPAAHPVGTTISVSDLFYNTPARRKFLRAPKTEIQHIESVVIRLALSHFETAIKLRHNQRDIFSLPIATTQAQREQRLKKLLSDDFLQNAYFVEFESAGMKLSGWLAEPRFNRAQADMQYFYINSRFVRDKVLAHALKDAYHDVMFHGRHSAFILFLTIDPSAVDVNVHPTKHEVRFRDSHTVHEFVRKGVSDALQQMRPGKVVHQHHQQPTPMQYTPAATGKTEYIPTKPQSIPLALHEPAPQFARNNEAHVCVEDAPELALGHAIAQLNETYIVAQNQRGMILVDMHAAHERVLYEKIKAQLDKKALETQVLLVPIVINLSHDEIGAWHEHHEKLTELTILTEQAGPNEIIVREIPVILAKANVKQLVQDSLSEWASHNKSERVAQHINVVLATIACHAAVRAPHKLSLAEMEALLRDMEKTPHGGLCNHGRPTWKQFNYSEIDQWFLRGR